MAGDADAVSDLVAAYAARRFAVARLSVEHRTVLVRHHRLGLTFHEVAVTLGIPTGTAESRIHRATAAGRDALTTNPEPSPHRGQVA